MRDTAEYWVTSTGDLLSFKFPARIDRNGQFGRLGPYFNLPSTGLDINALKKTRAQFELRTLDESDTECPPQAMACSNTTLETLITLYNEVEAARAGDRLPNLSPFWRSYEPGFGDYFSLVVHTEPLFQDLPATGRVAAPKLTRADIGKSGGSLSPSKARAAASKSRGSTSAKNGNKDIASGTARISDLADPRGRYAGLLNSHSDLADARVVSPDIRDTQGDLIAPKDYESKITDRHYVEVEVILRLWNIAPNSKSNPNGSRVYQLILKSMKLLPFRSYTRQSSLHSQESSSKGKRKADTDSELGGQSRRKKTVVADPGSDMDFED
ncbi:hypothetical protein PAXINDRAFT_182347 [Paxillus involutus ATCC 200175]|uniref:Uncharacterized protein n=1 Tax=Paxillus involutus ATCC 200175 TaxID=664439 RepID=A0A0C9TJI1_PAXIN|nr:hypothetical protein PAXINDRAFT_182347 [Paxillus involutus ATCC 200175]